MIRYLALLAVYIPFYLLAMPLAPILPLFAVVRDGAQDNGNAFGSGHYLPLWLSWFCTGYDNSLEGDAGWRNNHCPKYWDTYLGRVLWLWRNPAAGFCWKVLPHSIALDEEFTYTHSGNGLNVDKGKGLYGWYYITSSYGAFSLRWCKRVGPVILNFEAGWLLDVYIKDAQAIMHHPKAAFQFQPQIKRLK